MIPTKPPELHQWAKHPDDHVKINFDGSFNATSGDGGWGYIIRDRAGKFIAAGAGKSDNLGSALQSEAVACLAAILGADKVVPIESSLNLMRQIWCKPSRAVESFLNLMRQIGMLVKEARILCTLNYESFNFTFSRRTYINVLHELANRGAISEYEDSFWDVFAPNCIATLLDIDLAVLV
jgi:hypothetical protein